MRELYIDCRTGAAGDMMAAALLELFDDKDEMLARLNAIGIPDVEFSAESVTKHSIAGTHMNVRYKGAEEDGAEHSHHGSGISDIYALIDGLNMSEKLRNDVKNVYRIIAEAESRVHGCDMKHIHFHELGTMDAVADISAVCFMTDALGVQRICASPVCTGFGEISCAHGILSVPAPATALILEGVPCFAGDMEGELCTPTGAALVKYLSGEYCAQPEMTVTKLGLGMGRKNFPKLSAVRVSLGEAEERIIELCCNVDDMSPEAVGFAIDELLRAGAPDAYYEAIGMKKNRPGLLLTCLCREDQRDGMVRLMFKHTTTLGIRETQCRRYILKRDEKTVTTAFGTVRVKLSEGFGVERKKAEFDDLARIARENDLSLDGIRTAAENIT